MLQRKPTRIELKAEDKEELEAVKREREAAAQQSGKPPLSPLDAVVKKPTAAQRIGLTK